MNVVRCKYCCKKAMVPDNACKYVIVTCGSLECMENCIKGEMKVKIGGTKLIELLKRANLPDQFVLVSVKDGKPDWEYATPSELREEYSDNPFRYEEINYFLATSKPGHFIPLDDKLLFKVSQE